jgi:hypothetical protein
MYLPELNIENKDGNVILGQTDPKGDEGVYNQIVLTGPQIGWLSEWLAANNPCPVNQEKYRVPLACSTGGGA